MKITDIKEANDILVHAKGWLDVFNQAAKDSKAIKVARDKVSNLRREAGSGTTGQFLAIAKHYPTPDQWAAAWAAMKYCYGKKEVPQTLMDAYSVIRRSMIAGINGAVLDDAGKPKAAQYGDIAKADSFNSLKVGLAQHSRKAKKDASTDVGLMAIDRLREVYLAAEGEAKVALLSEIRSIIPRSKGIDMVTSPVVDPEGYADDVARIAAKNEENLTKAAALSDEVFGEDELEELKQLEKEHAQANAA